MDRIGIRDFDIHWDVLSELDAEPGIVSTQVGVQVGDGIVTLLGNVASLGMKDAAARAAHRVEGVRAVVNLLRVHTPVLDGQDMTDVARTIARMLLGPAGESRDHFEITVSRECVILDGAVRTLAERQGAEQAIRRITGAHDVLNRVVVAPTNVDATAIHGAIERALIHRAQYDARQISVEIDNGTVILRGKVSCSDIRDEAARATVVSGVHHVHNQLMLERHQTSGDLQGFSYMPGD